MFDKKMTLEDWLLNLPKEAIVNDQFTPVNFLPNSADVVGYASTGIDTDNKKNIAIFTLDEQHPDEEIIPLYTAVYPYIECSFGKR